MAPPIAITPDCNRPSAGSESQYVLRMNYAAALARAGSVPVILPYDPRNLDTVIARFDGFVITGTIPGVLEVPERTRFELQVVAASIRSGKLLLGICNGMQLIGLALGGRLIDDLTTQGGNTIDHLPFPVPDQPAHAIELREGSWQHQVTGAATASVNSFHRQAIDGSGRYRVAAVAPDGTLEAIEGIDGSFTAGAQWHAEYGLSPLDDAVFSHFVSAARQKPI